MLHMLCYKSIWICDAGTNMYPSQQYWFRYMLEMSRYTSAKTPHERNVALAYANGFLRMWFAVTEGELNSTYSKKRAPGVGTKLRK